MYICLYRWVYILKSCTVAGQQGFFLSVSQSIDSVVYNKISIQVSKNIIMHANAPVLVVPAHENKEYTFIVKLQKILRQVL